jgi:hypothetical protein
MSDGASLGIGPERALKTILGGEPEPTVDERQDDESSELKIRRAPLSEPDSYEACGLACARIVLEYLEHNPSDIGVPIESLYDRERWKADGMPSELKPYLLASGLYDRIKEHDPERGQQLVDLGLTGFLWGWGFNAARKVMNQPTEPNPAILEIRT